MRLSRAEKGGKEVLYYKKDVKGKASTELLSDIIDMWIKSLDFGKSMRWGSLSQSFIRPIRWVNVMFGDELVDVELFGVKSSKNTFVHRISNFESVPVNGAKEYFEILKDGGVTLFSEDRMVKILNDFKAIETENRVTVEIDDDLLDEVVAITEKSNCIAWFI